MAINWNPYLQSLTKPTDIPYIGKLVATRKNTYIEYGRFYEDDYVAVSGFGIRFQVPIENTLRMIIQHLKTSIQNMIEKNGVDKSVFVYSPYESDKITITILAKTFDRLQQHLDTLNKVVDEVNSEINEFNNIILPPLKQEYNELFNIYNTIPEDISDTIDISL
jgi:hypothetical protein